MLTLGLLVGGLAASGCGAKNAEEYSFPSTVSTEISQIRTGESLKSVRARLGPPAHEYRSSGGPTLFYGPWQLFFVDAHLERKILTRDPPRELPRAGGEPDRRILGLRPGSSMAEVEARLGRPSSYQEVFEDMAKPEALLFYGSWELGFRNDRLVRRTKL